VSASSVAAVLAELLSPVVGRAFQVPGAGNLPFVSAWSERGLPWFTALEEKRGLTMAHGFARVSGKLALMSTTAGPGVTNLATALALALREQTPVFVVSGQTPSSFSARLPVQELDNTSFARDLTLRARLLTHPEQLSYWTSELVRVALDRRQPGPVLLSVPADLWQRPCERALPIAFPEAFDQKQATDAAQLLVAARRPLVIAGSGVVTAGSSAELRALIELLPRARVVTTPRAIGAFPSAHPQSGGAIGFGGGATEELDDTDLVLVLGSRLHEMSTNFDDRLFSRTILQIDLNPDVPGRAVPVRGFVGDLAEVLPLLARAVRADKELRRRARRALSRASALETER
jgi:acetolactate synthase I/II/III large subunit